MGVDDTRKTETADSSAGTDAPRTGPDAGPHRDEGTPATDAAAGLATPTGAADLPGSADVPPAQPVETAAALARDEGTTATDAAASPPEEPPPLDTDGLAVASGAPATAGLAGGESGPSPEEAKLTPEEYRREGAAHSGRAGAADRATDRILADDRHAGYLGRADQKIEMSGEERAAAQRDFARAAQAERSVLEHESLDLFVRAQQLERAGDAAGASALRGEAEAKVAAASDRLDQALGHLDTAHVHESVLEDRRVGQYLSAQCESIATALEMAEVPGEAGALKDVAAQGLRVVGAVLETSGPQGLREAVADIVVRARGELAKRL